MPSSATISCYRPVPSSLAVCVERVLELRLVENADLSALFDILVYVEPYGVPPSHAMLSMPASGAHDMLRFSWLDGDERVIILPRSGYRSVRVEGRTGYWAPTPPVFGTVDMLLPPELREEQSNPLSYPPDVSARHIDEREALAICGVDLADMPGRAFARLMTRAGAAQYDPGLGAANLAPHPARLIWLVSVHADASTRGSLAQGPKTLHGYSIVIDAETGTVTDSGVGTAPLGRESCPVCSGRIRETE